MNRREFLWMAAGASGAAVLDGCRTASVRDNAALRAAVDGYVADGLYLGLACASNCGDLSRRPTCTSSRSTSCAANASQRRPSSMSVTCPYARLDLSGAQPLQVG